MLLVLGFLVGQAAYDAELDRLMDPAGGVVVPEPPSDSGKGKMISVLIWRRRS